MNPSQPDPLSTPAPSSASASQSQSTAKSALTIDDITRLFSLPISEAASSLGVSTGVLKRLCRKNGIAKWPYRQLLSGKSLEDIKKEAEIEKSNQKDAQNNVKRKGDVKSSPSISTGPSKTIADQDHRIVFGQGFYKTGSPNSAQLNATKHFPSYMDEFKYGFPSTGLSSCSTKWWGTEESPIEETETLNPKPSEVLCELRRKAVGEMGAKGFEGFELNKRQKMVLTKVFGSALPEQWKNIVS